MVTGRARVLSAAACLLSLAACNREALETSSPLGGAATVSLPSQILGLKVTLENPGGAISRVERPYFDRLALFSFREEELLRASLEIGRFNAAARPNNTGFQQQILQAIGTRKPEPVRVGRRTINVTSVTGQNVFVWFEGRGLFVLITHQEYSFPRTLLRRLLAQDMKL